MFKEIFSKNERNMLFLFSIFLIAILAFSMIEVVNAGDKTISPTTSGGLKKAIDSSQSGTKIILNNGVYAGGNNQGIKISKNITIQGNGKNVVIDGKNKYSELFQVISTNSNPVSLTIKNVKIKNFNKLGYVSTIQNSENANIRISGSSFTNDGLSINNELRGVVTVSKTSFKNSRSMPITNFGTMKISGSTFINNKGATGAGAIENQQYASMTISNCRFIDNRGINAGAVKNNGDMIISRSIFTINTATARQASGGAIYNQKFDSPTTLKVTDCKFKNNVAAKTYNAIFNDPNGILTTNKNIITQKDGVLVNIIDKGSFNIRGKKVIYYTNMIKNQAFIDFYWDDSYDSYFISKNSNKIKVQFNNKNLKTYTNSSNLKSFYLKTAKKYVFDFEKTRLKKKLK